ncbi:hypothetical protein EDD17DRAFT_1670105 [Pisolithus thermaeus]|nr:hypothetical protein EDD17DRAFT_1670105 [Pisolithus thermaeus]
MLGRECTRTPAVLLFILACFVRRFSSSIRSPTSLYHFLPLCVCVACSSMPTVYSKTTSDCSISPLSSVSLALSGLCELDQGVLDYPLYHYCTHIRCLTVVDVERNRTL